MSVECRRNEEEKRKTKRVMCRSYRGRPINRNGASRKRNADGKINTAAPHDVHPK